GTGFRIRDRGGDPDRCGAGTADCLRERGKSAAFACFCAPERDCHPDVHWSQPVAADSANVDGEHLDCDARGSGRFCAGVLVIRGYFRFRLTAYAAWIPTTGVEHDPGLSGAGLLARIDVAHGDCFW